MKAAIVESPAHSQLPPDLRRWIVQQIQSERPYSPCDHEMIDKDMYDCTADGCVTVLLYTDDGQLIAGGEIISITQDFHVGDCLTYLWSWIHPEHRGGEAAKHLVRIIRECTKVTPGIEWYMLTREVSPRVFKVSYSKVTKHGKV